MKPLLLIILLLAPFLSFCQCDDSVRPISGMLGYKERGEHCEGFYRSLVSANDLQIVHFTKGPLTYSSTEAENITLSIPVSTSSPVNVRSLGIPRNLFYQMDVILKSDETFNWNTGTVLLKKQKTKYARMIGLLGFTEANERRVYIPIKVNNPESNQPFQIKLVSSTKVQQLKWRLRGKTEYVKISNGRAFTPGRAITFRLPNNLTSGEYTLEILGKESDGVTNISKTLKIKL